MTCLRQSLVFCLFLWACWLLPPQTSIAQTAPVPSGFQSLPYSATSDFVACSPDGRELAVVKGGSVNKGWPCGTSLQVWSLDSSGTPQKLLFQDNRKAIFGSQVRWAGQRLFYSLVIANSFDEFMQTLEVNPTLNAAHWHGYFWDSVSKQVKEFEPARELFIVSGAATNGFIVIGAFSEAVEVMASRLNASKTGAKVIYPLPGTRVDYYKTLNLLAKSMRVQIQEPNVEAQSPFIPLSLSADDKYLLGLKQGRNSEEQPVYFLVSVSLDDGSIKVLTSDDEADQLELQDGKFFSPGKPAVVKNGTEVVCALEAFERNLDYRYLYFNPAGKLLKELRVAARDERRCGLPLGGDTLAFTPAGDALIQTDTDIWVFRVANASSQPEPDTKTLNNSWLYQMGKTHSELVANNIRVKDVFGWAGPNRLLVRAHPLISNELVDGFVEGKPAKVRHPVFSEDLLWGFLNIPPSPTVVSPGQKAH